MQKILITGASSYVGARLYVDLKKSFDVVGTYNSTKLFPELTRLDITNKQEVDSIIKKVHPEWIVHVVANPFANWCEANPEKAKELNETGTENIVSAANSVNARVIYISSFAAINPSSLYGKTKLAGEEFVKKTMAGFVILQPSLINLMTKTVMVLWCGTHVVKMFPESSIFLNVMCFPDRTCLNPLDPRYFFEQYLYLSLPGFLANTS